MLYHHSTIMDISHLIKHLSMVVNVFGDMRRHKSAASDFHAAEPVIWGTSDCSCRKHISGGESPGTEYAKNIKAFGCVDSKLSAYNKSAATKWIKKIQVWLCNSTWVTKQFFCFFCKEVPYHAGVIDVVEWDTWHRWANNEATGSHLV